MSNSKNTQEPKKNQISKNKSFCCIVLDKCCLYSLQQNSDRRIIILKPKMSKSKKYTRTKTNKISTTENLCDVKKFHLIAVDFKVF